MAKKSDHPLEKVTLNLFAGEFEALRQLHPELGAATVVRELVHAHLIKVEQSVEPARVDLPVPLFEQFKL